MGVPSAVILFFQALYQDNSAIIYIFGRMFGSFSIGRGVRQGDPSSMLLFILAVEPVLAWVRAKLPSQLTLSL
eukprot:2075590-Pyramimonas_sp.AAC.1